MNPGRGRAGILLSACLVSGAAKADEVVYHRRVSIDAGGVSREEVEGSPTVVLSDGSTFTVGADRLEAPDGTRFGIDADVGQAAAGEPTEVTLTVWRLDDAPLTDADAEAGFRAVHPEASDAEVAEALRTRSEARGSGLVAPVSVAVDLAAWLEVAPEDELAEVSFWLRDAPRLSVPLELEVDSADPVAALDRIEARVLAVEAHLDAVEAHQAEILAAARALGATVTASAGLSDSFTVRADAATVAALVARDEVARAQFEVEPTLESNDGRVTRKAMQLEQYVQAGNLGQNGSGLWTWGTMMATVIDDCIDEDHPAWNDFGSYGSRLAGVSRYDTGLGAYRALQSWEDSATSTGCHGGLVSAVLASDLTNAQDPSVTDTGLQADRSGIALETGLTFIEVADAPSYSVRVGRAVDVGSDLVNTSLGWGGNACDVDDGNNAAAETLYWAGALFSKSAGNGYHGASVGCTASNPAAGGAALVAGSLLTVGVSDLQADLLQLNSSQGGDVHGRALVDLVLPGRETSNLPVWNDTYKTDGAFLSTSSAAPALGAAALNLRDHLTSTLTNPAFYNAPGTYLASMLLMGDGASRPVCTLGECSNQTATAMDGDALDPRWGAGRLRMRLFEAGYMDPPWRARWCIRDVCQGDVATCLANPNSSGGNESISPDVERVRVGTYWFEPNLGSVEDPAEIYLSAIRNGITQYWYESAAPGKQRLREDDANGGIWSFRLDGWCVPEEDAVADPENPNANCQGEGSRTVYVALYWEDMDRESGELDPEIQ